MANAEALETFLIDSNVLIDVIHEDPRWIDWSSSAIGDCLNRGKLAINPLIYAEVSVYFVSDRDLDAALPPRLYERLDLPYAAARTAASAFHQYRKAGGTRTSLLPDFYIGAHAQLAGCTLVSRDSARYKTYFPKLKLISPKHK
ncbi:type II toxin-antitoxin system VapC family toxin [Variovorax ginsengisoli]|uniref:Type II toxin-antitoxin system VapC family toxin n=1 Tax=Variovorax ginsengisoli TaxID=363844 RepID=A0ABT8S6Z8_9BURK|nr:type II toxin-antitoxin system VapC family toxin [Variovorax ginsengisoli]MDN8615517.1 type II toxin-antitoxin system VapC family toxin [Variovorax ginsengisoli]MDO1534687.1 type II toxin-antitoxin system VapC family toxin [Variovorax ginsengisoli]